MTDMPSENSEVGQFVVPDAVDQARFAPDGILLEPSMLSETAAAESKRGLLRRIGRGTLTAAEMAVYAIEVLPFNEAARVSVFIAAQAKGLDPMLVGAAYGGSTLAIEGVAALAATDLLHSKHGEKVTNGMNGLLRWSLNKVGVKEDTEIKSNLAIDAGITLAGGSAVLLTVDNIRDTERTKSQDLRRGLTAAAGGAGFCAVQGYLMSKGIDHPSPFNVGVGLTAFGSVFGAAAWVKRKLKHSSSEEQA